MATVTGETVSVFTPSVTAEGMTSVSYSINVEGTTLETDAQGNISVAELKKITETKYGKAPEQRTLTATVSAFIAMGDEVLKETGIYTRLGYWHDRKGENEIDIIAEDEIDNKIEFIEVKRQAKNFDENILKSKSELFMKAVGSLKGYNVVYRGLSIEDM
jgi:hypothetical protein